MLSDHRHVLVHAGAEVPQGDQRLAAGVLDRYAPHRRLMSDENFVPRLLAEVDHHRRLQGELADPPAALHRDPAAGPRVAKHELGPRLDRQLLGRNELLAVEMAIVDPAIGIAGARRRTGSTIGST